MGCFNMQCGYSDLEVHEGDEVKLFLLTNNHFGDGFIGFTCYPHDCYDLMGPGISATYDEYGWYNLVNDNDLIAQNLCQYIAKILIPLSEEECSRDRGGKSEYMQLVRASDEASTTRPPIPWNVLGDMIHDGELFVKNKYGREVRVYVSKFAIHKHFYDKFNSRDIKEHWYKDDSPMMRDALRARVQKIRGRKSYTELLGQFGTNYEELTEEQKDMLHDAMMSAYDTEDSRMEYVNSDFSLNQMCNMSIDGKQLSEDELVDAFHGLIGLHGAMSTMNKKYLPQGPGHQCYNFEEEIEACADILEYVKQRHKEKMIEWGEYEEDEE